MIIVKDMAHCCLVTRPHLSVLQFKWSRKGFVRTRWIVHNQYVLSSLHFAFTLSPFVRKILIRSRYSLMSFSQILPIAPMRSGTVILINPSIF